MRERSTEEFDSQTFGVACMAAPPFSFCSHNNLQVSLGQLAVTGMKAVHSEEWARMGSLLGISVPNMDLNSALLRSRT